jgi:hypothetical protein
LFERSPRGKGRDVGSQHREDIAPRGAVAWEAECFAQFECRIFRRKDQEWAPVRPSPLDSVDPQRSRKECRRPLAPGLVKRNEYAHELPRKLEVGEESVGLPLQSPPLGFVYLPGPKPQIFLG